MSKAIAITFPHTVGNYSIAAAAPPSIRKKGAAALLG
jgi:hypothetical protein